MNRERLRWLVFAALSGSLGIAAVRTWWPQWLPASLAAPSDHVESLQLNDLTELTNGTLVYVPAWARQWQSAPWPENPFPTTTSATRPEPSESRTSGLPGGSYVLHAVLWGRAPVALLSGRLVTVGSRLPDGSTVEQILTDRVVLATGGGRVEIPLARSAEADEQEQSP